MVRNRIDLLESKFGVATLDKVNLIKNLGVNLEEAKSIYERLFKRLDAKSVNREKILDDKVDNNIQKFSRILARAACSGSEAPMSQSLAMAASIHYLRWKYTFRVHNDSADVQTIMKYLRENGSSEEEFCLEIAYLFTRLSTIGIRIPALDDVEDPLKIRNGLQKYGYHDKRTLVAVDAMYSVSRGKQM